MSFAKISRTVDILITWSSYLACVLLVFSWLSVCAEVIGRYFLNRPIPWVVEVTEYILVQITFLGAAWLLRKEGHVSVDILTSHMKPTTRYRLLSITSFMGFLITSVVTIWGVIAVSGAYRDDLIIPKQLGTPKYLVMIVIPVGSLLLAAQFLRRIMKSVEDLRSLKAEGSHCSRVSPNTKSDTD